MHYRLTAILLVVFFFVGCSDEESSAQNQQVGAEQETTLDDLKFVNPEQKERLAMLDQLARGVAKADWEHEPWQWSEIYQMYRATWHLPKDDDGPYRYLLPDAAPAHHILLMAETKDDKPGVVRDISISVHYYPKKGDWGTWWVWGRNIRAHVEQPAVSTELNFVRQQNRKYEGLEIEPSRSVFFGEKRYGDRVYTYREWG